MTRDEALARLRRHEGNLKKMGVRSIFWLGPTAHAGTRSGSDGDLFDEYEKGTLGQLEVIGEAPVHGSGGTSLTYAEEDDVIVL